MSSGRVSQWSANKLARTSIRCLRTSTRSDFVPYVIHHINNHLVRIGDVKPADTPRLVCERIHDLNAHRLGLGVIRIYVGNLNTERQARGQRR